MNSRYVGLFVAAGAVLGAVIGWVIQPTIPGVMTVNGGGYPMEVLRLPVTPDPSIVLLGAIIGLAVSSLCMRAIAKAEGRQRIKRARAAGSE